MSITLRCLLLVLSFCLLFPFAAGAAEPFRFGDMKVYPLLDVAREGNPGILIDFPAERLARVAPSGKLESAIFAYAVQFPDRTILLDAGLGKTAGGKALDALRDAGLSPEDIDAVVISHMHFDHIGGLSENGMPVYPRARILLAAPERDWWLDPARAGSPYADGAERAKAALAVYPGKVSTFVFGEEILPGVTAVDAAGHTPGHTVLDLDSGGGRFLFVGDIMHVAEVQFPFPEVTVTYDVDKPPAAAARKRILKLAVDNGLPVAGMHLPPPGIWKVKAKGEGYERIAAD